MLVRRLVCLRYHDSGRHGYRYFKATHHHLRQQQTAMQKKRLKYGIQTCGKQWQAWRRWVLWKQGI